MTPFRKRAITAGAIAVMVCAAGAAFLLRGSAGPAIDAQVARLHFSPGLVISEVDHPAPAPALRLSASTGGTFDLANQKGQVVAVVFGYTHCPDICPTTLADYAAAIAGLTAGERAHVRLVFVSVDPERDTTSALGTYLAAFDPTFVGLSGSVGDTTNTARHWQFAFVKEPPEPNGSYFVSHDAFSFLVDRKGNKRAIVPTFTSADTLTAELRRLIKE